MHSHFLCVNQGCLFNVLRNKFVKGILRQMWTIGGKRVTEKEISRQLYQAF